MIYFNNRNGSSGLTGRLNLRLISATAIYGRLNSSLCWKGRWYPIQSFLFDRNNRKYMCKSKCLLLNWNSDLKLYNYEWIFKLQKLQLITNNLDHELSHITRIKHKTGIGMKVIKLPCGNTNQTTTDYRGKWN